MTSSPFSLGEVGMFKQVKFCAIVLKILSVLAKTDIIFTLPLSSQSDALYHYPTKITAFCCLADAWIKATLWEIILNNLNNKMKLTVQI